MTATRKREASRRVDGAPSVDSEDHSTIVLYYVVQLRRLRMVLRTYKSTQLL